MEKHGTVRAYDRLFKNALSIEATARRSIVLNAIAAESNATRDSTSQGRLRGHESPSIEGPTEV